MNKTAMRPLLSEIFNRSHPERRALFLTAVVFLVIAVLQLPSFFVPYFSLDETEYAAAGMVLRAGGAAYRDILIHHPPMIFFVYAAVFRIFGAWNLFAVHGLFLIVALGNAWGAGLLSQSIFGIENKKAVFVGALLYGLASHCFWAKDTLAANTEMLLNFCLIWSGVYLRRGGWATIVAGSLWGAALSTKLQAVFFLPAAFYLLWNLHPLAPAKLRAAVLFGFGALIVPLGFTALFAHQHVLQQALHVIWDHGMQYARLPSTWFFSLSYIVSKILTRLGLLGALTFFLLWGVLRSWRLFGPASHQRRFVVIWFFAMLWAAIPGARLYWHYFLLLLPPMCVLATPYFLQPKSKREWFALAVMLGPLLFFQVQAWRFPGHSADESVREAAQFIDGHTATDDRILVWGFLPQIYLEARRLPATRFVQCDALNGMSRLTTGQFPGENTLWQRIAADMTGHLPAQAQIPAVREVCPCAWPNLMGDLRAHPPAMIVDASLHPTSRYDWPGKATLFSEQPSLMSWVAENYRQVGTVHNILFYLRKDSQP